MKSFLKLFKKNEEGQGMVEYGLIIGLIAIIVIAVFVALGPQIRNVFNRTLSSDSLAQSQGYLSSVVNAS